MGFYCSLLNRSSTPHNTLHEERIARFIAQPLSTLVSNNTWARVDTEFLLECSTRKLTSEQSERVRCRVERDKRNFISTNNHVLI